MSILLAFLPFIAFALVDRSLGALEGLAAGAIVSALLIARDLAAARRSPKILEIGTFLLFAGLLLYALLLRPEWTIMGVRLRVDLGLLAIVLVSMAAGRPFTLQYAREDASPQARESPLFLRANYVISGVWALAFLVIVLADLALDYAPDMHPGLGVAAIVLALVAAARFTRWYPRRLRETSGA